MSENKPVLIALGVVGVALVGLLIWWLTSAEPEKPVVSQPIELPEPEPEPVEELVMVEEEPEPMVDDEPEAIVEETPEPVVEEPAFVLPRLDDSDQLIRDGVVSLTRHEGINAWLGPDELIRKFVAFVDNVSNGSVAKEPAVVLAPRGEFKAEQISEKLYVMDQASYQRYNLVTDIFTSIDAKRSVEFYVLLKPLFQDAYEELGYPDGTFDEVIFKAIGRLLETPVITKPITLVRPVVMYEYEDKKLENLSAAQKQMIRMGPDNTRAIQEKLSEIARELRSVLEG